MTIKNKVIEKTYLSPFIINQTIFTPLYNCPYKFEEILPYIVIPHIFDT